MNNNFTTDLVYSVIFILMVLPWIFSFVMLYKTKGIKIWIINILVYTVLMVLLYAYLAVYGNGPTRFGPADTIFAFLTAIVVFPLWGLFLWIYSNRRKKRLAGKPSSYDDILDTE